MPQPCSTVRAASAAARASTCSPSTRSGWQKGFETADNTVTLLGADDEVIATVSGTKREVADALWDARALRWFADEEICR